MGILISLFISFAKIGALSIGGGLAMVPFIQDEVIVAHAWMTHSEFNNILAISNMTPGPIAVNSATYVGYKVGGFWGSVAATVGVALPSFIMILLIATFFIKLYEKKTVKNMFRGLRPAVVGLIAVFAIKSIITDVWDFNSAINIKPVLIYLVSFVSLFHKKVDPMYVIIASAIVGILIF